MKKTRLDRQQDFLMWMLRPLVRIWMRMDAKRKVYKGEGVDFKRKEPFIMLANHTFMFDVVHVPLDFKNVPFIVANHTLFKKNSTKFLMTQVAHVISKSKGQSDQSTVRDLLTAIKKGYPILIFPEGDTTFFGETNYIEESTMKLIKKLQIDVITCTVKGGYLSKPRWAKAKRKNRSIELHYQLTIPKENIKQMSVDEINQTIKDVLYVNAYEDQKEKMIARPSKNLASGLEDIIYVCPTCQKIHTIMTKDHKIICKHCHTEGYMDDYGFIHGFEFDNLVDWNHYQKQFSKALKETRIETSGLLFTYQKSIRDLNEIGRIHISYDQDKISFSGAKNEVFDVLKMENPVVTFRSEFTFSYSDTHYLIKVDHSIIPLLRAVQNKY